MIFSVISSLFLSSTHTHGTNTEENGKMEYFGLSYVKEQKVNEICFGKVGGRGSGKSITQHVILYYHRSFFPLIGALNETKDGRTAEGEVIRT